MRIAYADGVFVAVTEYGKILTSVDGRAWVARHDARVALTGIARGNGIFVVTGYGGRVVTSPDAVVWTDRAAPTDNFLQSVAFGDGYFVAVGNNGTLLSSLGGSVWTPHPMGTTERLRDVAFGNGQFVAVGDYGTLLRFHRTPAKEPQTIDFPSPGTRFEVGSEIALAATASSGLPVQFSLVSGPGEVGVSGNLSFTGAGVVVVRASQPGNVEYLASPEVELSFDVLAVSTAQVVDRYVFYNNSKWDGNDPGASPADDGAVAPDKVPLLPGGKASFANYTSYSRGLNGIIVDIAGLGGELTASDFGFRIGNSDNPADWAVAPNPTITVRPGAGTDGSDRVTLIWADGAIQRQWLQVTVKATANTGLPAEDVFYLGNAVGETGLANTGSRFTVSSADAVYALNNAKSEGAAITEIGDHNRDQRVTLDDATVSLSNLSVGSSALLELQP